MYPSHIFVTIYYFSSNFLPLVVVVISWKSYDSSAKHSPCHCCDVMGFQMLACVTIFVGVVIQGLRQHQQLGFINSCKFTESGMVVRYARYCSHYDDFRYRHKCLVDRLPSQGYKALRLEKSFKKFYGRYQDLIEKYRRSVNAMVSDSFPGQFLFNM